MDRVGGLTGGCRQQCSARSARRGRLGHGQHDPWLRRGCSKPKALECPVSHFSRSLRWKLLCLLPPSILPLHRLSPSVPPPSVYRDANNSATHSVAPEKSYYNSLVYLVTAEIKPNVHQYTKEYKRKNTRPYSSCFESTRREHGIACVLSVDPKVTQAETKLKIMRVLCS